MTILQMVCGNFEKDQLNIDGHMFATTQFGLNFGIWPVRGTLFSTRTSKKAVEKPEVAGEAGN